MDPWSSVFFFFQAEDGIRDDLVTGVQTCALPILTSHSAWWSARSNASTRILTLSKPRSSCWPNWRACSRNILSCIPRRAERMKLFARPLLLLALAFTPLAWAASPAVLAAPAQPAVADKPDAAVIASAHHLATEAGHQILAAGGNAFDAAVAVSSVLSVVEPISSGLGGGGFFLLHDATSGKQTLIDARETAPASGA